jgi:hypothetical protein
VGTLTIFAVLASILFLFLQNQTLKSQLGLPGFKPPWTKVTCELNGQVYQPGDPVPSGDSCNSCSCEEQGVVGCTTMLCKEDPDQAQTDPTADWELYLNDELGFQTKHPSNYMVLLEMNDENNQLVMFSTENQNEPEFEVRLNPYDPGRDFDNYQYLDSEVSGHTIIDSLPANIYKSKTGYCDAGSCGLSYISYAVLKDLTVYNITFFGDDSLSENESQILSTFKFTNTPSVANISVTPTPFATYTDQEYGYSITYPDNDWQFRHTYGQGGISYTESSGLYRNISGLDLHKPNNLAPAEAVIVLTVREAHGESNIDEWFEKYGTNMSILDYTSTQTIKTPEYEGVEHDYKYDDPDDYQKKIRFIIYDDKMYMIDYKQKGQIRSELQQIVDSFQP